MKIKRISIVMAMEDEVIPLLKKLNLTEKGKCMDKLPPIHFSGMFKGVEINLVLSGKCNSYGVDHIGTQAAVLTSVAAVEKTNPELIISIGTAGGFASQQTKIGDVFIGYPNVIFHDRRINIPGFKEYGFGFYPTAECKSVAESTDVKLGVISTGNSLDYTDQDLQTIKRYNGAVKDMEAASVAWVAQLYGIKFMAIKAITDLIDSKTPTEVEFLKNLSIAAETLSQKSYEIIDHIVENGLE